MYILHPGSPLVTPDFFTRNHSILSGLKILHFCEDLWNGKQVCMNPYVIARQMCITSFSSNVL